MKRHITSLTGISLLIVISGSFAAAQSRFRIGVLGGANVADASISVSGILITTASRTVVVAGGLIERKMSDMFFAQIELVYIQKGPEYSLGSINTTGKLSYLEVPILITAKFGEATVKPVLLGGITIASLMTAELENRISGTKVDIKSITQPLEVSIVGGGGLEFAVDERIIVFANGRYALGLTDVDKGGTDWKSRGIQIVAGLMFGL